MSMFDRAHIISYYCSNYDLSCIVFPV